MDDPITEIAGEGGKNDQAPSGPGPRALGVDRHQLGDEALEPAAVLDGRRHVGSANEIHGWILCGKQRRDDVDDRHEDVGDNAKAEGGKAILGDLVAAGFVDGDAARDGLGEGKHDFDDVVLAAWLEAGGISGFSMLGRRKRTELDPWGDDAEVVACWGKRAHAVNGARRRADGILEVWFEGLVGPGFGLVEVAVGRVDGGVADDHAQGAGQQGAFQRGSSVFQGWVEDEAADGAQSAGTWDEEGVEDGKGDFALGLAGDGRERGGVDEVVGGVEDDEVAPFGGGADESVVAVVGGPGGELDGEVHGGFGGGAGERALRPMPGASESTVAHLFEMLALKKN